MERYIGIAPIQTTWKEVRLLLHQYRKMESHVGAAPTYSVWKTDALLLC